MIGLGKRSDRASLKGRYEIERTIGHGGMASVFAAYDQELDRPVALKLLADNLCGDEEAQERFKREARIAARLAHPNIVAIFDVGQDDGRPYIVMEYVEGKSLSALLQAEGPLSPDRAVALVRQACAGLEHAHEAGVVHRDVKPKNMLLRDDGVLKVADFGIARAAEVAGLTRVGDVVGSPPYIAPEQMHGRDISPATDVYGLGVLLHHLITGQSPYSFHSLPELAVKQDEKRFEPLRRRAPSASAELEAIVARCLEPSRRKRIRSTQLLDRKLSEIDPLDHGALAGEPGEADAETNAETAVLSSNGSSGRNPMLPGFANGMRRRRISLRMAVVAGAIVLAIAAEIGAVTLAGSDSDDGPAPSEDSADAQPGQSAPPIPSSDDPAEQARSLSQWLRDNSR
jgi:serine/threonine-protein kinase